MTIIANLQTARRLRNTALELKEIHADLVDMEAEGMRLGIPAETRAPLRAVIDCLVDGIALAEKAKSSEDVAAFLEWYGVYRDRIRLARSSYIQALHATREEVRHASK